MDLVILYIFGALISTGIMVIWNYTFIRIHLFGWIFKDKDIVTIEEFDDEVEERSPKLAELISCPLCLGFWVSVLVATTITLINQIHTGFIVGSAFSWPTLILLTHYFFDNGE